jgi:hypothetical protein
VRATTKAPGVVVTGTGLHRRRGTNVAAGTSSDDLQAANIPMLISIGTALGTIRHVPQDIR